MIYDEFLTRVIDDGLAAATDDYQRVDESEHLRGSIDGFEQCRHKLPHELALLLDSANEDAYRLSIKCASDYWYWQCRALEIEWTCNCVSALLLNEGSAPLASHLPTARGMLKMAEIVGVKSVEA